MNANAYIAALEYELEQARGVKPGGQVPNADRVAAIEVELNGARQRAKAEPVEDAEPAGDELETADRDDELETADGTKSRRGRPTRQRPEHDEDAESE